MKVFFSGVTTHCRAPELGSLGVKNFLVSYENPANVEDGAGWCAKAAPGSSMMVDSGAFSAWSIGKPVILSEYIEFCKDFIAKWSGKLTNIYIVGLDVIPGERGRQPTPKECEDSARQGWENSLEMVKAGLTPIPIFHRGENFKWLDLMASRFEYIGIAPKVDVSVKVKMEWLKRVFSVIKANNKTHGFAVTSKRLMEEFPWFSVDSSSWLGPQRWGCPAFGKDFESLGLHSRVKSNVSYLIWNGVKNILAFERKCTGLWAARGVEWDD